MRFFRILGFIILHLTIHESDQTRERPISYVWGMAGFPRPALSSSFCPWTGEAAILSFLIQIQRVRNDFFPDFLEESDKEKPSSIALLKIRRLFAFRHLKKAWPQRSGLFPCFSQSPTLAPKQFPKTTSKARSETKSTNFRATPIDQTIPCRNKILRRITLKPPLIPATEGKSLTDAVRFGKLYGNHWGSDFRRPSERAFGNCA
jgi:hypothetical protein